MGKLGCGSCAADGVLVGRLVVQEFFGIRFAGQRAAGTELHPCLGGVAQEKCVEVYIRDADRVGYGLRLLAITKAGKDGFGVTLVLRERLVGVGGFEAG